MPATETIFARTEDTTVATTAHGVVDPWGPEADDETHIVRGLD